MKKVFWEESFDGERKIFMPRIAQLNSEYLMNFDDHCLYCNGEKIVELNKRPLDVLEYLCNYPNHYKTVRDINNYLEEGCLSESAIRGYIHNLREYHPIIKTVLTSNRSGYKYTGGKIEAINDSMSDKTVSILDDTDDEHKTGKKSDIFNQIKKGLELYSHSIGTRYINDLVSSELIPYVSDFECWLGNAASIELRESVELLWKQKNWNSLYIGKSGFGKTTACFLLINEYLHTYNDILPIYVDASKCINYESDWIIVKYIKETYIDTFRLSATDEDIYNLLFSENKDVRGKHPRFIVFIDGISSCNGKDCTILQAEFDLLKLNSTVQTILLANSAELPIIIGDMAVQRFDFQRLSSEQIDNYLASMDIENNTVSYDILSNPLILTIFAKTNNYLGKYKGETAHYMRKIIESGADVLWNMLEMFAIRFSEEEKVQIQKLKKAYAFRFIIPSVAWFMEKEGKSSFTLRDFCGFVDNLHGFFVDQLFSDVFDEYFGYENELVFSLNELRNLLDNCFVSRAGILDKNNGRYYFDSEMLRYFFSAAFLYRYLIVRNVQRERIYELEGTILCSDTCKYIGELTGENKNSPYANDGIWSMDKVDTEIQKMLSLYRHKKDSNAKNAVSNLVQILKVARNNNLAGVDLSYLDLRRNTFSHVILSAETREGFVTTNFDNSIIDQWCFMTPGYCQDNASIKISGKNIYFTDALGNIDCYSLDKKNVRCIWKSNDFIQDFDLLSDGTLLVSEMHSGVFIINDKGQLIKNISQKTTKEVTLYHRVKCLSNNMCSYITRSKKLCTFNLITEESRIINANAMDFVEEGESLLIATRGREIKEYNFQLNQVVKTLPYGQVVDAYISRISLVNSYIYASTKDGQLIRWHRDDDKPEVITDLGENITDFKFVDDCIYLVTDEGALFKGDSEGNFNILFRGDNRWGAMDVFGNMIAIVSIEGAALIYYSDSQEKSVISDKQKEYRVPYLTISGCSFKGVDIKALQGKFVNDLQNLGAIIG